MIATLHLPNPLRDSIAAQARAAFPKECCGLIEGTRQGTCAHAMDVHAMSNLADIPDRFEIDPAEQIKLMRKLRGTGREIIGCYHSHPNGRPEPSGTDLKSAFDEEFLWLIAALGPSEDAAISAFIYRGGAFAPIRLARAGDPKV